MTNPPNQSKYLNRDFQTLTNDFVARLRQRYGDDYNDFVVSSLGGLLIDLVAFASDQIAWVQDRRIDDTSLALTESLEWASIRARELGYSPAGAVSASKEIDVSLEETYSFPVQIPAGFRFQGPGDLTFQVVEGVEIPAGSTGPVTLTLTEGRSFTVVATSSGRPNQVVSLSQAGSPGVSVASQSVEVTVDGAPWSEVERLRFEQGQVFEVEYTRQPPRVRFGDGVTGDTPGEGAEIRVRFLVTSGERGNVAEASITEPVEPLIANFQVIPLVIDDANRATGGMPPESLASIKANAPGFFAARGVAVTVEDYKALASAFRDPLYGRPARATAFVARQVSGDAFAAALIFAVQERIDNYQAELQGLSGQLAALSMSLRAARDAVLAQTIAAEADLVSLGIQHAAITAANTDLRGRAVSAGQASATVAEVATNAGATYDYSLTEIVAFLNSVGGGGDYADALDEMRVDLLSVSPDLTDLQGALTTQTAAIRNALGLSGGLLEDLTAAVAEITAQAGVILADLDALDVVISGVSSAVSAHQAAITADLDALRAHLDEVLSADCKSNVISVPIVAFDQDGFYAPPSRGLIRALQRYLRERCDVAHVPIVVDGSFAFVPADIEIQIAVLDGFVYQRVASGVREVVRGILRARDYGASLEAHTLHRRAGRVAGVDFLNVTIKGPSEFLSGGNLVIPRDRVITPGPLAISEVVKND